MFASLIFFSDFFRPSHIFLLISTKFRFVSLSVHICMYRIYGRSLDVAIFGRLIYELFSDGF